MEKTNKKKAERHTDVRILASGVDRRAPTPSMRRNRAKKRDKVAGGEEGTSRSG